MEYRAIRRSAPRAGSPWKAASSGATRKAAGDSAGILHAALLFIPLLLLPALSPRTAMAAGPAGPAKAGLVTPCMEVPLEPGLSVIFCSSFQIAWTGMADSMIGGPILLEKRSAMVDALGRGLCSTGDADPDCVAAMAGFCADGAVSRINRALKERFGAAAPAVDDPGDCDDAVISFAAIIKKARFSAPFQSFSGPVDFIESDGTRTGVRAFGIEGAPEATSGQRQQVEIADYAGPRDFIVRIRCLDPEDEVVLAMIEPGATLLETFEAVRWRIAASERDGRAAPMSGDDILRVPCIDISRSTEFTSLLGLHLLNPGFREYFVAGARQDISFSLDQDGAGLSTEASFVLKKGGPSRRVFSFDRPFLVYMKRAGGRYPYIAVWVEDPGVLETL